MVPGRGWSTSYFDFKKGNVSGGFRFLFLFILYKPLYQNKRFHCLF